MKISIRMNKKSRFVFCICIMLCFAMLLVGCDDGGKRRPSSNDNDRFVPIIGGNVQSNTSETSDNKKTDGNYSKRVAITYDDGPHVTRTAKIVDELDKYGYHATFFVVGNRVDGREYAGGDAMQYAVSHGNEIGIHAYTHDYYYDTCNDSVYKSELSQTAAAIRAQVSGYNVRLMRPVGGRITETQVKNSQYSVIMWDVDSEDWKYKYSSGDSAVAQKEKVEKIVDNVMENVQDGSIILMHDIYESTYDATVVLLERLHEEGYEVVTVSELLGRDLCAGKSFSHATRT